MPVAWESHAPPDYACPFCGLVAGDVSHPANRCELGDLVHQDEHVVVFIACDGFGPYPGHAMICPTEHLEALYDMDDGILARISSMSRDVALAMKLAWDPEGTSTRQHNEPAGNQHVWHYHLHVFPRWRDDMLYRQVRAPLSPEFRAQKAAELRPALEKVLAEKRPSA
ncbi:HIT family protein [Nesterenkonia populi]